MGFNVRVYGLLIDRQKGILVSEELIKGRRYLKFPGGGLQMGEGTRDGLKREFREELGIGIEVQQHFYTTDFYQESAFRKDDQIISVYYYVKPLDELHLELPHVDTIDEYLSDTNPHADQESFRFIALEKFSDQILSFPIDKVVGKMLMARFAKRDEPQ